MSARDPSIDVQFAPFKLRLTRWSDGQWIATLHRIGHEQSPPLVTATADPREPTSSTRIEFDNGAPRLRVGSAVFDIPKRQIKRLADWIDEQNRPVVQDGAS